VNLFKIDYCSWVQWLKPTVLATWEVEIGRLWVPSLPRQKVCETPSQAIAGLCGSHLSSQLHREAQIGGS
jgi:hypothetical protein